MEVFLRPFLIEPIFPTRKSQISASARISFLTESIFPLRRFRKVLAGWPDQNPNQKLGPGLSTQHPRRGVLSGTRSGRVIAGDRKESKICSSAGRVVDHRTAFSHAMFQ